jgi:hypothetical protein
MSVRAALALAALAVTAAACAPMPPPGGYYGPPQPSGAFRVEDFAWSQRGGQASIEGRIAYARDGQAFGCSGSAGLTPDTPYTRSRFLTLYGSTDRAAIPEAVVRARNVPDPNADYRGFVRSAACSGNRFSFTGLPDGGWFIIAPVSAGSDRVVLMQRVETRGGRVVNVIL